MIVSPRLRKLVLTVHVTFSVGWLGAVAAYLVLAITGLTSQNTLLIHASYLAMERIGWLVIVPLSLASLTTGLIQSLCTPWGLFRHYWILAKLLLTLVSTLILLKHMSVVSYTSASVANTGISENLSHPLQVQHLVHAAGGILVLLFITALSMNKPFGLTPYGHRKKKSMQP